MAVVGGGLISDDAARPEPPVHGQDEARVRDYRRLGRTGFEVSDIGFGAGYLNNANVLQVAMDMGVNYIDTAEHYANGASEQAVGEALQGRDRSSVFLTTKLNMMLGGSTKEAIRQRFHRCLERLQTDYVDCLMLHMTPTVEQITHEGFHAAAQELKAEGKVRFLGLSNHGTEHSMAGPVQDRMEDIIGAAAEDGRFDVALFVYNFLQQEQGERIIEACKAKDMGVTLMKTNPVAFAAGIDEYLGRIEARGRDVPESIARMAAEYKAFVAAAEEFKARHHLQSDAEVRDAAIRFVLGNPDVHAVCPSINTFDELDTFVALSGQKLLSGDGSMLESYEASLGRFYCRHACGICEPSCPQQVPVNAIMRYNHYFVAHGRQKHAMEQYASLSRTRTAVADVCLECPGYCEAACPHGVPVRMLLTRAHEALSLA
jgi:predicted aldo/keto reductase-like oxidoreductase